MLRQLCLAVGVLALHMEEWHATVVNDLITSLTTPPEEAAAKLPCLLQLLLVLPEEAENYKVNVVPRRRDNFRSMLSAHSSQVLMLLHQVCTQFQSQANTPSGEVVLNGMMKCVSSWMHYVAPENREFQDALASLPLIPFGFSALAHKPLFDAASDLVVETVHFAADSEARDEMVPKVLPSVLSLVPLYDAAVAAEDEESAKSYCRIFAEAGEQFLNVSRRHRRRGRRRRRRCRRRRRIALNARMPVCPCALVPILSPPSCLATSSCNDQVLLKNPKEWALPAAQAVLRVRIEPSGRDHLQLLVPALGAGGGRRRMLSEEEKPEVKAFFAPLFLEVVDALRVLVELPDDSDTWSDQDTDDFKRFATPSAMPSSTRARLRRPSP